MQFILNFNIMAPSLSFSLYAFFVFSVIYLCAVAKKGINARTYL